MPTLEWIGKKAVINHHREVPYHLLKCDAGSSVGEAGSGNLLVQGDNLVALNALRPTRRGQISAYRRCRSSPPYQLQSWILAIELDRCELVPEVGAR